MRALVIDDSRAMRAIIKNILTQLDFEVAEAGDGQAGLDRLRHMERPDLILVDWNMPVMNGIDFIRAVRADPSQAGLPIVMVTTETDMARVASALEVGADEYVMKPCSKDVIEAKLKLLGIRPEFPGQAR